MNVTNKDKVLSFVFLPKNVFVRRYFRPKSYRKQTSCFSQLSNFEMRVKSYSCQLFRSKAPPVKSVLNRYEILLLQETFLPESESGALDDLDDEFVTAFVPAV